MDDSTIDLIPYNPSIVDLNLEIPLLVDSHDLLLTKLDSTIYRS